MTQTDYLISGIRQILERPVSPDEMHQLKRCMLDWVGVSIAGAALLKSRMQPLLRIASSGPCSAFVADKKLDLHSASFLNGYASHALELDDGHRFGMLHLEALIFSALLATAQQEKVGFCRFVKGVLVGYQTTIQLARRLQPEHKKEGYHGTGTCGTVGVACAVAAALGFDDSQMNSSIGAAVTRASGLLTALDSPSELKPYNVAGAVESGIMSSYLGRCGFLAQSDPIDGKRGFFKTYARGRAVASLVSFNDTSEILNIYFKPYASCRHCHAPVECALKLREEHGIEASDIERVSIETYRLAIDGHDHVDIPTASSAKMSIPYSVASALVLGSGGMEAFVDERVQSEVILALTRKVQVKEDESMTALSPGMRGARVKITTYEGREYMTGVDNPLGEPEHPMTDAALERKYYDMMTYAGVDTSQTGRLKEMIWNLETGYDELLKTI